MDLTPYFVLNSILGLTWIAFYVCSPKLRTEMLIMSLFTSTFGLTQIFFIRDYWRPEPQWPLGYGFDLDSIVWAFFWGGIAAIIYERFFSDRYLLKGERTHYRWLVFVLSLCGVFSISAILLLKVNTMYAGCIALLTAGVLMLKRRSDLLKNAIWSGVIMGILMLSWYELVYIPLYPNIMDQWWLLNNLSGIHVLNTPLEELLFAFTWGFFGGPLYEFVRGLKSGQV